MARFAAATCHRIRQPLLAHTQEGGLADRAGVSSVCCHGSGGSGLGEELAHVLGDAGEEGAAKLLAGLQRDRFPVGAVLEVKDPDGLFLRVDEPVEAPPYRS